MKSGHEETKLAETRPAKIFYFFFCFFPFLCLLTHKGSPSRGPTMARKRGCWSRANRALIKDCMPVRLPN